MSNQFTQAPMSRVDSSRFNLSHDLKTSFKFGQLIPTLLMECLPGDNFTFGVENMLRLAPLVSPVMHRINVTTHYFFVPYRLMWNNWEKWITKTLEVEAPYINVNEVQVGSLLDYMGLPVGVYQTTHKIQLLPLMSYIHVWNEYYRDENLQTLLDTELVDGDNTAAFGALFTGSPLRRAWQHDYFTSCLPFAQKGDAVQVPLTFANNIPVEYIHKPGPLSNQVQITRNAATGAAANTAAAVISPSPAPLSTTSLFGSGQNQYINIDPNGTLVVDVQSEAVDINTLRRAFALQVWLERNARGGTRYTEFILAHYNTRSSDARLQRPEYLGGSKQKMVISEVLATAQNDDATVPVGNMAGHGISVGGGNTWSKYVEEFGVVIGLINVQPETAYYQGIHRMFKRADPYDYAFPVFANIGEQEVYNYEIFALGDEGDDVFGYIPRYSEYRFLSNRVSGEMKTNLLFWHMARKFDNQPNLNAAFIEADPTTRIFAVEDASIVDHIYAHIFNNISAVRKLPKFGIPTI